MRRMILVAALGALMVGSSGCATILGGIIGHQSGEMCAGMAIGAVVDIVGGALGNHDQKERDREDRQAPTEPQRQVRAENVVTVYSGAGYIRVDRRHGGEDLERKLKEKFAAVSWVCADEMGGYGDDEVSRDVYKCSTKQGKEFEIEFFREEREDVRIYVRVPGEDEEMRGMITSQVGLWVTEIAR